MAGGHAKKVTAQNASKLKVLNGGLAASLLIYVIHLFIFKSGRTWFRHFLFLFSEAIAVFFWAQLVDAANKGQDLAGEGLISYMQDICYVTWFVHLGAALVSPKFWHLYLVIPGYAGYRFVTVLLPQARAQIEQQQRQQQGGGGGAGAAGRNVGSGSAKAPEPTSKRQAKLQKRYEKGDKRLQQREVSQAQ